MQKLRNCPGNPEEMRKGMVNLDLMSFPELRCAVCGRPVMAAYQSHPLMLSSGVMTLCGEGHAVTLAGALGISNDWRAKINQAAEKCQGCGKTLDRQLFGSVADGCLCNSPRGVNHGLVPRGTCTCPECDPAQTGAVRKPLTERRGYEFL